MSGGDQVAIGDFDGDGTPDMASFNRVGVLAQNQAVGPAKVHWAHNLPPEFALSYRTEPDLTKISAYRFEFGPALDLNNDGGDELFVTVCNHDGSRWRMILLDGKTGTTLLEKELPVGQDIRQDGHWDGDYHVLGVLPAGVAEPGSGQTAIVACHIQYDRVGRGILAVDLDTGEILWTFDMVNNPNYRDSQVVDLDGDEIPEVVVFGGAPGNLQAPEECVDGMCDDAARLFVLSATGSLRWMAQLTDTWGTSGNLCVGDYNRDGKIEVVAATSTALSGFEDYLYAFSSEGELLARYEFPDRAYGLDPIPGPDGTPRICLGTRDHLWSEFSLEADGWEKKSEVVFDYYPNVRGHVNLGQEKNLVLAYYQQGISLYQQGKGLMEVDTGIKERIIDIRPWQVSEDRVLVAVCTDRWRVRELLPAADQNRAMAGLVALPLVLSLVPSFWAGRGQGRPRTGVLGPAREEIKRDLARRLKRDNHNRLTLLKSLDSLVLNLEWVDRHAEDEDQRQRLLENLKGRCARLAENDLPSARTVLEFSQDLGLAPRDLPRLTRLFDELELFLTDSLEQPDPFQHFRDGYPRVRATARELDVGLEKLADEFATEEGCDLWAVVQDVLLDHRESIEEEGVSLRVGPPPLQDVRVIVPREDLTHLFDNLVGNACKFMRGMAPRMLSVNMTAMGRRVICEIRDTGPGIDPEVEKNLFNAPVNSETGTGEGLYDAARVLAAYDGRLEVVDPGPDGGAKIRLTLTFL